MRGVAQLGDGIDEGAAPEGIAREPTFEPVKHVEDLREQGPFGCLGRDEVPRQIGDDELVLRRKIIIERALADADFRRDRIDANGADALPVEQAAGWLENAPFPRLFGSPAAHDCTDLCNFCLTGGMKNVLLTPIGVVKWLIIKEREHEAC